MKVFVIGLVCCLIGAAVAALMGLGNLAWIIGNLGTFVWVFGVLFWAALFDSRKRWAGESFIQRLGSIMSFRSD